MALLRRVMLATAHKRTQSEIERSAELTRVERESLTRRHTESRTSSVASFDEEAEDGIEEDEGSDEEGEDVFDNGTQVNQA